MDVKAEKKLLREEVWRKLEKESVARFPLPCHGRIPNFAGSEKAAQRLRLLKEWKNARVVFVNPDYAQQKVREYALLDDKILVVASPRLKQDFVVVDPKKTKGEEGFASTIKGAFKHGKTAKAEEIPKPDLIVEGSVAVDSRGHRLGKGHGYGDIEISVLKRMFGPIPTVTTIHNMQIVEAVPFEEKDEKVTLIVTPTEIIRAST